MLGLERYPTKAELWVRVHRMAATKLSRKRNRKSYGRPKRKHWRRHVRQPRAA